MFVKIALRKATVPFLIGPPSGYLTATALENLDNPVEIIAFILAVITLACGVTIVVFKTLPLSRQNERELEDLYANLRQAEQAQKAFFQAEQAKKAFFFQNAFGFEPPSAITDQTITKVNLALLATKEEIRHSFFALITQPTEETEAGTVDAMRRFSMCCLAARLFGIPDLAIAEKSQPEEDINV